MQLDYSEFLLQARQNLKAFEDHMLNREFSDAITHAELVVADARLLTLIAKETK